MTYTYNQYKLHAAAKHKWDNKAEEAKRYNNNDLEYKYRGKALDARSHADSLYNKMHPNAKYDKGHINAKQVFRDKMKKADKKRNGSSLFF